MHRKSRNSHVVDESIGAADVAKLSETDLGDDSSEFPGSGGNTVCGGTVAGGKDLTGDDEGGGVGTEVLEEVG